MNSSGWEIPNPFINHDGKEIRQQEEWEKQRQYLAQILAEDLYGEMPPAPGNVEAKCVFTKELWSGAGLFEVFDLSFGPDHCVQEKTALIRSSDISHPTIPIVLCGGYVDEEIAHNAVNKGFCIATPLTDDAAPDTAEYQQGTLFKAYPTFSFKVIAMWGWLMSRVIDWLITLPFAEVENVVAIGHSRYGKAALCCAVYDERVSICAAAGSGCGGMGSLRIAGSRFGEDTGAVETLGGMITGMFPHWFRDELIPYGAKEPSKHYRENELRFDSDFIGAAIAPRPLLILEGLDDTWANPYGTMAAWNAVSEVYHFLDKDEDLGIHFREGGHALNADDWAVLLDFCRNRISGEKVTSVWHTRGNDELRMKRSWSAPKTDNQDSEPVKDSIFAMSPERLQEMKDQLNQRWVFKEAGLETGMDRFLKMIIERAGTGEA